MISNLNEKLQGKLPITREELFELVSSWGRSKSFWINGQIFIRETKENQCYDLSKLDVSQITNMDSIFKYSKFDGDISNWNTSNVINMYAMFYGSKFNSNISKWDVSNVTNMISIFSNSNFNGDISNWGFNENVNCSWFANKNKNFINKYNYSEPIPEFTKEFLEWFEENKELIRNKQVSVTETLDINDYLSSFNNIKEKELL